MTQKEQPLRIALLGIGDRDRGMLEFFFNRHCTGGCDMVNEEQAQLCILDLDGVKGRDLLQQQLKQHPHRPLIALSIRDEDIDGVQFLRKPLQFKQLHKAVEFYRSELAHPPAVPASTPVPEPAPMAQPPAKSEPLSPPVEQNAEPASQPDTDPTPSTAPRRPSGFGAADSRDALRSLEAQSRLAHECCGPPGSVDLKRHEQCYYDPASSFQGLLQNAVKHCRQEGNPLRLSLSDGKSILLLPQTGLALTDLSDAKLRPRSLMAVRPGEVTEERPPYNETHLLRSNKLGVQRIDSLLWKVALWSARGRLPADTDPRAPVTLRHWPNMTQLLTVAPFLRIAALWSRRPLSIEQTAQTLAIEDRYVCAFYSGCHCLGLVQTEFTDTAQHPVVPMNNAGERQGLLRRILNHLRVA